MSGNERMDSSTVMIAQSFGCMVFVSLRIPVSRELLMAFVYILWTCCLVTSVVTIVSQARVGRLLRLAHGGQGLTIHVDAGIRDDPIAWQHVSIGLGLVGVTPVGACVHT